MNTESEQSGLSGKNEILIGISICLIDSGFYEEAVLFIDEVLAADPHNLEAVNVKADSLMCLGMVREALACFDKAIYSNLLNEALEASKEDFLDDYSIDLTR